MSHKVLGINLATIRKNKVTLTLNKPAYIVGMFVLELRKVWLK